MNCRIKLSSPEVALWMQDSYYKEKTFAIPEKYIEEDGRPEYLLPNSPIPRVKLQDDDTENVYGVTLYREEENIYEFCPFEYIIDDYVSLEIKKFFGYTLDEYLNKTYYEVEILRKKAIKLKEEIASTLEKIQNKKPVEANDAVTGVLNSEQENLLNGDEI